MSINTGTTPVKPSQVSVATSLSGSERLLATRVSGPTAPKTIAVTTSALAAIVPVSVNVSDITSVINANFTLPPSGVSAGIYGTSVIIPQITVNSAGQITSVINTTLPPFLTSETPRLMWSTISASSGNTVADVSSDNLAVRGDNNISTSITGDVLTIFNTSTVSVGGVTSVYGTSTIIPRITVDAFGNITSVIGVTIPAETPRLMWATVSASSGSTTADTSADNLAVRGGNNISTSITGDVLTIFNTSTVSVGGATSIYGTSIMIPRITVDAFGNITSITQVSLQTNAFSSIGFTKFYGDGSSETELAPSTLLSQLDLIQDTVYATVGDEGSEARTSSGVGGIVFGDLIIGTSSLQLFVSHKPSSVGIAGIYQTYGTSTRIPQITLDAHGHIVSIALVTAPAAGAGTFTSVSAGTSTFGGTNLNIRGAGTNTVDIVGGVLTITGTETARNIWATVSASSGSATADVSADNLAIRGDGSKISTSITGDVLTVFQVTSLCSVGGATSIYGTSTIIPRITVDHYGNIVSITNVTAPAAAGAQDEFKTIAASAGSTTADSPTDTLTVLGDSSRISTSITGDTLTVFAVSVVSVGGATSIYGTSTIIPRITVDPFGNIVSVVPVTLPAFLLTETPRLIWATISASSGSTTADVSADNLAVRGDGTFISTSITGDVLTIFPVTVVSVGGVTSIYGTSTIIPRITVDARGYIVSITNVTAPTAGGPETPRLIWATISASSGSTTADVSADNLAVRGDDSGQISTSITVDALTVYHNTLVSVGGTTSIYGTSTIIPRITVNQWGHIVSITNVTAPAAGGAQNLWATVSASSGSTTADNTTDNLAIRGDDSGQISTSITGDILTVYHNTLVSVGGTTSTYAGGSSSFSPRITVNEYGHIVSITSQAMQTLLSVSNAGLTVWGLSTKMNMRGGTGVDVAYSTDAGEHVLTYSLVTVVSVGGETSTYGTSSVVPRITVNADGRIVSITNVTTGFLVSAGTVNIGVSDKLTIKGQDGVSVNAITGDVVIAGNRALLHTFTCSATTEMQALSVFTSTYNIYDVEFRGVGLATAGANLAIMLGNAGVFTSVSLTYNTRCVTNATAGAVNVSSPWAVIVSNFTTAGVLTVFHGSMTIYYPTQSNLQTGWKGEGLMLTDSAGSATPSHKLFVGTFAASNGPFSDIKFLTSTLTPGNFAAQGNIFIYGRKSEAY